MASPFTGYKHIAGKGEQYAIDAPNLSEIWAKANKIQRMLLVEKMKRQGGFDFVTYHPAKSIQFVVINWITGNLKADEYGVIIGDF